LALKTGLQMDATNGYVARHKMNKGKNKFYKQFIYEHNILELFALANVKKNLDFLSVDIDYNDFYVLGKILTKYRPRMICCEFNAVHKYRNCIVPYAPNYYWDRTNYYNAGIVPYQKLCNGFKYDLIYCDSNGVNLFMIDRKLNAASKFINANKPKKLWKPINVFELSAKKHKNDYHKRNFLTYELATHKDTVPLLCELDAEISLLLKTPETKALIKQYLKYTKEGDWIANEKVEKIITNEIEKNLNEQISQVSNKKRKLHLVKLSKYIRTLVVNYLVIKFRESKKINKKY
jgi:hypothetical protein